jgi:hypothetical protein
VARAAAALSPRGTDRRSTGDPGFDGAAAGPAAPTPRLAVRVLASLLATTSLVASPYIALAADVRIGTLHLDTPIADLAAAALVPVGIVAGACAAPPATLAWAVLLVCGGIGALLSDVPVDSVQALVRKPLFMWLAYGGALAAIVARAPRGWARGTLATTIILASTVLLVSSLGRIAAGEALWIRALDGLTPNHKTLAVALAPQLPLLWGLRRGPIDRFVLAIALVAVALSASRTAWIALAAGAAHLVVWRGRPLAARRGAVLAIVVAGALAAIYGPVLGRSVTQLDAARSRHSLNVRAAEMFAREPWVGMGAGGSVRWESVTFPHYRVNGVDAHGVVQKLAGEHGVLGLFAWSAATAWMAWRVRSAAVGERGRALWATFVALHVNLLFSTETFSQTHWAVLGLVLGLARRQEDA